MANEQQAANAADKTGDKPARRSRHRSGRTAHSDSPARPENLSRPENPVRSDRSARSEKPARHGNSGNSGNPGRTARSVRPAAGAPVAAGRHWTWRDYLLQLSVVIAGIVVTFAGSGLIDRWRQARQVRTTMQLVYDELKINRTDLNRICKKLRHDRRGMLMFQNYGMDVDKIPTDSLEHYMFIIGSVQSFLLQTDALEVLKTSGVIPSIGDKVLLMETLGCYRTLDGFNVTLEFYNSRKIDALNHLFANTKDLRISSDDPREAWQCMMDDPMCSAFMGTSSYNFGESEEVFDRLLASVDQTVAALKDKYRFE